MTINVANGEKLGSRKLQQVVGWEMQGHVFHHQFNLLRLGSCDVVLGVDWLVKYSPIEFNFKQLTMKFLKGNEPMVLKGEVEKLRLKPFKGSKLAKWRRKQAYGITAQLYVVEQNGLGHE